MKASLLLTAGILMLATAPSFAAGEAPAAPPPPMNEQAREAHFKASDADGDGALNLQEFTADSAKRAEAAFTRLDANADGKVTQEEMMAGFEAMRAKMKERKQ